MKTEERDAILNSVHNVDVGVESQIREIKKEAERTKERLIKPLLEYLHEELPFLIKHKMEKVMSFGIQKEEGKISLRELIEDQMKRFIGMTVLRLPLNNVEVKLLNEAWKDFISIHVEYRSMHVHVSPELEDRKQASQNELFEICRRGQEEMYEENKKKNK